VMKKIMLFFLSIALSQQLYAQDVLRLGPDEEPGIGSLENLAWLQGYWVGTGLGGEVDELWLPVMDNSMIGTFRLKMDSTLIFSEYMVIEEVDEKLILKLKHFNKDLSPWEEKDQWTEFKFIKSEGQTAWFSGLTYQRVGDTLNVYLRLTQNGQSRIETFSFLKTNL
jgi:hypothetical protein